VNPAISFDDAGNSYLSALGANEIEDYTNNYLNLDSEVYEVQGFTHGTYSNVSPNVIDAHPAAELLAPSSCATERSASR